MSLPRNSDSDTLPQSSSVSQHTARADLIETNADFLEVGQATEAHESQRQSVKHSTLKEQRTHHSGYQDTTSSYLTPALSPPPPKTKPDSTSKSRNRSNTSQSNTQDEASGSRVLLRQITQLREENQRLRWELNEVHHDLERLVTEYSQAQDQFDNEAKEYRRQLTIAQLQIQQLQTTHEHISQLKIEEEARRLIADAAQTMELAPDDPHPLLRDVAKTIEFKTKQEGDRHTTSAIYMVREAQRKAELMQQSLQQEQDSLAAERQKLIEMQQSVREQADLRYKTLESRLKARWTAVFAVLITALLALMSLLQLLFFALKLATPIALFLPLMICVVLAGIGGYLRSVLSHLGSQVPQKKKVKKT